jgi:hypothetical protein
VRRGFFAFTGYVSRLTNEIFLKFRPSPMATDCICPTRHVKKQIMQHFAPCSPSRISLSIYVILIMTLSTSRSVGEDVCHATQGTRNKGMASAGLDTPLDLGRTLATL